MQDNTFNSTIMPNITLIFCALWIVGFTVYLIKNPQIETWDIFLGYFGGTFGFAVFGPIIICIVLLFLIGYGITVLLKYLLFTIFLFKH